MPKGQQSQQVMRVVARPVYNPEKADRGLKAMADILAWSIRSGGRQHKDLEPPD